MPNLLIFDVADTVLALATDLVQEVLPLPLLSRPPHLPALIEGFFNLHGRAATVIRLDRLLGLNGRGAALYAPLLLLRPGSIGTGDAPLALLVDSVRTVRTIDAHALLPVTEQNTFNGCIAAELAETTPPTHLLSLNRLLLEHERQCIREHQAVARRRAAELGVSA
ncbi:MAG: chemotaxis protein CheW [Rhodospirillaceae bacterium]